MRASNTPHDSSMITCGPLPACSRCHQETLLLDSPERPSGRTAAAGSSGITPSTIMSPATQSGPPSTEIRLGVYYYRAQKPVPHPRVLCQRAPPKSGSSSKYKPCTPRLTRGSFTDKEQARCLPQMISTK
jgi:hypothetical protein